MTITVLTPYTAQVKLLTEANLGESITVSSIDGFQGREADIIIFSTVRCQIHDEKKLGFLEDPRRLNVAWTRARRGRICVGDRATLQSSELWRKAVDDAKEVYLPEPKEEPKKDSGKVGKGKGKEK